MGVVSNLHEDIQLRGFQANNKEDKHEGFGIVDILYIMYILYMNFIRKCLNFIYNNDNIE